ncbi:MipA/OmpV family protein [Marinomonas ostreistagni]|uniref:MipA/OmpV family protein n=1 Tax=Marinomonas ostreistagni TaxID=359209 RepID=UPI00194DB4FB|nr:MipA/OmpV family protein [Marinomonas ostreistagni]MBM6551890.1 MipA/OmpV family protein [Marinomonas ostreistagni]
MSSSTSLFKYALLMSALPIASYSAAAELSTSLGVGGHWKQEHIKGEHSNTSLFPYINLEYGSFSASPDGIGTQFNSTALDQFSLLLKYRQSPFELPENHVLRGLDERDDATEVALQWKHMATHFDVTSSIAADISDTHEGYEAKVKVSRAMETPYGLFIPAASLAYQSDDLVDYYYGVSAVEASRNSNNIQAYSADASVNSEVSLTHVFPITDHWHTSAQFSYNHLGSDIADSTIVKRSDFWASRLSVFYKF